MDDRDELETALSQGVITPEQHRRALEIMDRLVERYARHPSRLEELTLKVLALLNRKGEAPKERSGFLKPRQVALLAMDLDGTLLRSDKTVSDYTPLGAGALQEGIRLAVACPPIRAQRRTVCPAFAGTGGRLPQRSGDPLSRR